MENQKFNAKVRGPPQSKKLSTPLVLSNLHIRYRYSLVPDSDHLRFFHQVSPFHGGVIAFPRKMRSVQMCNFPFMYLFT
jgi:hypothetical protein